MYFLFSVNPAKLKSNFVYCLYTASVRLKGLPVRVELASFKKNYFIEVLSIKLPYSVVLALALVNNTFYWLIFKIAGHMFHILNSMRKVWLN